MYKTLLFTVIIAALAVCHLTLAASNPADTEATILKYSNDIQPDGSYSYEYGTSNNIEAQENGVGSVYAEGSYSYTAPDGQLVQLSYKADENGYQPIGDHLPTPPPIPDYILRGLAYIEAHPFDRIQLKRIK